MPTEMVILMVTTRVPLPNCFLNPLIWDDQKGCCKMKGFKNRWTNFPIPEFPVTVGNKD